MHGAEIPCGIAHLEALQVPVAGRHLEAAPLDDDGAVALSLRAGRRACEGELERGAVRARSSDLRAGEEAADGGGADLGVRAAVVLVLDPGLRGLVEEGEGEVRHVLKHGHQPALDRAPEGLLLGILIVVWPAT